AAQNKPIRLRNENIATFPVEKTAAKGAAPAAEVTGLYLIQFTGPFQAGWEEQLRLLQVELVRYVPEDAFIARLNGTRLGALHQLAFVRWSGVYRPEHKVHAPLSALSKKKAVAE